MATRKRLDSKEDGMTKEEYEKIMKDIRYNRQQQRKRLYEQAKRANKKEKNKNG